MMIILLVVGIGFVLAGLLAIAFGIPIKEFGFGNTLILVGAVAVCTGMILLGLGVVVRELKIIAQRLRPAEQRARTLSPSILPGAAERGLAAAGGEEFPFGRDGAAAENADNAEPGGPSSPPPWHQEAASHGRADAPTAMEPAPKPRRNLLFSSTSRKERERAQARGADPTAPEVPPPAPEAAEPPPAT